MNSAADAPPAASTWVRALAAPHSLYAILALAVGLRLAAVWSIDLVQVSDYAWYLARGRAIATGEGYSIQGVPTAYWPVGYPGFLGLLFTLFGPSEQVAKLANVALYLGVLLATRALAMRAGATPATANLAILLLALYPNHIAYAVLLSAEILFLLLLTLGTLLVFTPARWTAATAGALFGLATLVKPQAVLLPILLFGLAAWRGDWRLWLRRGLLAHVALVAVLLPWQLRVQELYGGFALVSANGGNNLLIGHNPGARGGWSDVTPLMEAAGSRSLSSELDGDRLARRLAIEHIAADPLGVLRRAPAKLAQQFLVDGEADWALRLGRPGLSAVEAGLLTAMRWVNQLYYVAMWAGAVWFFARVLMRRLPVPRITWAGACVTGYFALLAVAFFGAPRFHFPVMGWIAIYAALAVGGMSADRRTDQAARSFGPLRAGT